VIDLSEYMHLCLTDLLDQDLSSYEYFHSLPQDVQRKVAAEDVRSFEQLQSVAEEIKQTL
jgi:hypothetical protein